MDLSHLVEQLSEPAFYPEPSGAVDVIQTHISYLFLTDSYAYKVKKPVNFGFLDYTTLERRRLLCEKEVALNARLCPDTYLGVVPITRQGDRLALGGEGEAVEYAVKMVRLPDDRMLRHVLARGEGHPWIFVRIAEVLADFHARAASSPAIADMKRLDGVKFNCEENFQQTEGYVGRLLERRRFELIRISTELFLTRHRALFERRADEGRVRDGHGDVHLDSICVTDPVRIFDCIEFNERFRYQDVAEEVAFLAMDLEFHGYPDFAGAFVDAYVKASGDGELVRLLDFYKAYRAYVRAKINSFQLDDPNVHADRKEAIATIARRYYELAENYARRFNPRRLFITCGVTGSGKSTLARKLAEMYDVQILRSDAVRKELLGLEPLDRRHVPYGEGEYAPSITERTYATMAGRAEELLAAGHSVVLDGCFIKRDQRAGAIATALRLGVPSVLLECRASEEVIRERLERRVAKSGSVSDGRWEIYCTQLDEFEPPVEIPAAARVVLDRSRPIEELVEALVRLAPAEWREDAAASEGRSG
jgi:aminoglycoside phosphotransferase family enzyme/predicted kinase